MAHMYDGLVAKLQARQGRVSDYEFARTLALSRSMWRMVRAGDRRLGVSSLARVVVHYPELTGAVLDYVRDRNTE